MSFKREGNDSSLLSKLRKRRINELLGESIPDNEAKLLSNGRFTCTVCNSIPIFDTVNMLLQHRHGKKHLANQQIYDSKQRELKELIEKRKHQQFLTDGTTYIPMAASSTHGILPSAPYDPRVKKAKVQPTDRKPRINLQTSSNHSQGSHTPSPSSHRASVSVSDAKDSDNVSHSSNHRLLDIASQQLSGPLLHNHQLKNLIKTKYQETPQISPYRSKRGSEQIVMKKKITSATSTVKQSELQCTLPSQLQKSHSLLVETSSSNLDCKNRETVRHQLDLNIRQPVRAVNGLSSQQSQSHSQMQESDQPPQPKICHYVTADSWKMQKLRQLQGSGWKRDWDGKWIKDEDAEFDSDEEPPDL